SGRPVTPRDAFTDLRHQALHGSRETLGLPVPASPTEPWGVLMETAFPKATVTVVAFADGSASIYLSTGGGFIGGGGHDPIRRPAVAMVQSARPLQPQTTLTSTFPLPTPGQVTFYLRTDAGVFSAQAPERDLGERRHPLSPLFYAGQGVITQYRLQQ